MSDDSWTQTWMRAWGAFPDPGQGNPWTAMLEHFTRHHPAAAQAPLAEALERISAQSRAFFDLGQALADEDAGDWPESVRRHLDKLAERLRDPQAAAGMPGGADPMGYWSRFAGQAVGDAADPPALMGQIDKLLRMPGVGPAREHQQALQELSRLWLAYLRAQAACNAFATETARLSLERLRARLNRDFERGAGPASVRDFYDTWAQTCEAVYAERVATREYAALHGQLVNALMAYRRQATRISDDWARALQLPGRAEVDTLQRALHDMRHRLRALEAGGQASGGATAGASGGSRTTPASDRKASRKASKKVGKKTSKKVSKKASKKVGKKVGKTTSKKAGKKAGDGKNSGSRKVRGTGQASGGRRGDTATGTRTRRR